MLSKKVVKTMVEHILRSYPHTRDNDEKLVANVMHLYLNKYNIDTTEMSAFQLLQMYADSRLPQVDYITRVRRKLQETIPELRGNLYALRQGKSTKVKESINNSDISDVI